MLAQRVLPLFEDQAKIKQGERTDLKDNISQKIEQGSANERKSSERAVMGETE